MKVLIVAGGTGGHLASGVALYKTFKEAGHSPTIAVNEHATKFPMLDGISRSDLIVFKSNTYLKRPIYNLKNFLLPANVIKATVKSKNILKQIQPNAIVSVGGYSSVSIVLAAKMMKIKPIVVVEQNSVAGIANRVLSKFADGVAVAFPNSVKHRKVKITGSPSPWEESKTTRKQARRFFGVPENELCLGVLGGSQGAKGINTAVLEFVKLNSNVPYILWSTGESDFERVKWVLNQMSARIKKRIQIFPFVKKMDHFYRAIDLAISRAGASTLTELSIFGVPAVLIPYPFATENHQLINAKFVESKGGAIVIEQEELNGKKIEEIIDKIVNENGKIKEMSIKIHTTFPKNASYRVVEFVEELVEGRK